MSKQQFWKSAACWGMITGAALFVINILLWVFELKDGLVSWPELMRFAAIFAIIFYTGKRNAAASGPEGYSYGRAVGYVFAMMLFAGIIAGIGDFLLINFIAREYFDAIYATQLAEVAAVYEGTPQYDMVISMFRWMTNPIILILGNIILWCGKGGVLGLILAAFVKKNPDVFAAAPVTPPVEQVNE